MRKCCEAFRNLSGQPNMLYVFTLMNANIYIEARRWYESEKVLFKSQFCFLLWPSCISICGLKLHCNSDRSLSTKPSSSLSARVRSEPKSRQLMQRDLRKIGVFSASLLPFLCLLSWISNQLLSFLESLLLFRCHSDNLPEQ